LNWEKKTNPYSHHIGGILHETDSSTAMVGTGCERNTCKEISIFRCQFVSVFDWALPLSREKSFRTSLAKNDHSNLPSIHLKNLYITSQCFKLEIRS